MSLHELGSAKRLGRMLRLLVCMTLLATLLPAPLAAQEPTTTAAPPEPAAQQLPLRTPSPEPERTENESLVPALQATKRDRLLNDVDNDGLADPGDVIEYTVIISNTGSTTALDMVISDTLDPNVTLVGSIDVGPIAGPDTYQAIGNTYLRVGTSAAGLPSRVVSGSVLDNDYNPEGGALTIVASDATSTLGGSVTLNADGTFSYLPPVGATGVTDTFTYTIENAIGMRTRGTVSITIANRVWYVRNNFAGPSTGRVDAPFQSLAPLHAAGDPDASGDTIFVFYTGTNYSAAFQLENDQRLIGEAVALIIGGNTLHPAGVNPPVLTGPGPMSTVTLATNNTLRGFHFGSSSLRALTGANFGTLTMDAVSFVNVSQAMLLDTGTLAVDIPSLTASGGAVQVELRSVAGTMTIVDGSLAGATGTAFLVNGGTATIAVGTTINTPAGGQPVAVSNMSNAVLTFSKAITSLGRGISLTTNASLSATFSGALSITTASGSGGVVLTSNTGTSTIDLNGGVTIAATGVPGMIANSTGTVIIAGSSNTISATNAQAFQWSSSTTNATGVNFRSISSSGASSGVSINGFSGGPFRVTGTTTTNASGGTIANIVQRGYDISNASNISLANIALNNTPTANAASTCDGLTNTGCNAAIHASSVTDLMLANIDTQGGVQNAINGVNVTNLNLSGSTLLDCGNEVSEACIRITNLLGTSQITGSELKPTGERGLDILNTSGSSTLNLQNTTVRDTQVSPGGNGFHIITASSATLTVNATSITARRIGVIGLFASARDSSSLTVKTVSSTFDVESGIGRAISLTSDNNATLRFLVQNNTTISSRGGIAVNAVAFGSSNAQGRISTNTINLNNGVGSGVSATATDQATMVIEIDNNTVSGINNDFGIFAEAANTSGTFPGRAQLDAIIHDNTATVTANANSNFRTGARGLADTCAYVYENTGNGIGSLGFTYSPRTVPAGVQELQNFNTNVVTTWNINDNLPANSANPSGSAPVAATAPCTTPIVPAFDLSTKPALEQSPVAAPSDGASEPASVLALPTSVETFGPSTANPTEQTTSRATSKEDSSARLAPSFPVAIPSLPAGSSVTLVFRVLIDNPLAAGVNDIVNQASISGSNVASVVTNDPDTPTANDPTRTPVQAQPDLSITKSDGGATATPGSTLSYELTYSNAGNQGASGVTLTETVPANTTFNAGASTAGWSCANNAPAGTTCTLSVGTLSGAGGGGSATFAVTLVNPVPAGVTQISNTATVSDDGTNGVDPTPANNSASDTTPVQAQPDLAVSKTDGGITAEPEDVVVYTITYTNTGNQGATGVAISETVPLYTTFNAGASTAGWSCANGAPAGTTCTLPVGALNGGGAIGTATFAVSVNATIPLGVDETINTVSISDDGTNGADPTPGDNADSETTPILAVPDLTLAKTDGGISASPGATVAYTLTYENIGSQAAANAVITETMPAYTTFNAAGSTAGWSCAAGSPAGTTCTLALGTLNADATGTAVFAVTVIAALPAGVTTTVNTATIGFDDVTILDPTSANNTASDTTPLTAAPDLVLDKAPGALTAQPGATITYTLTYTNTGDQDATGVIITESIPTNTTFNAGASTPGWSCVGASCTFAVGTVAADASGSVIFAVTLASPVPANATTIVNTASIADDGANGAEPTPANNSDTATVTIDATADLTLAKTDGGISTTPGATLAYTLTLSNVGDRSVTGAVITETLPTYTTFNAGASTAGWSCVGTTCTFPVGALAGGDETTVVFAVTVASSVPAGVDQIVNSAETAHDGVAGADPTPANNTASDTTPLNASPDLILTKNDGGITTTPGATVAYTVTYENVGNQGATGVTVMELIPANTTFNAGASTAGWSCVGTTCTFSVGAVSAGATGSVVFAVTVNNPVPAGVEEIVNIAVVVDDSANGGDPTPGNNTASDSTPLFAAPDLTLAKTDGGITTTPGATVAYTLTYANVGNQGATGVTISETVPLNTSFDAGASTAGWSCADNAPAGTTCTLSIGDLAASDTGSATFAVTVRAPLPAGISTITNTAAITDDGANDADPTPGNNTASDTTPITAAPDLMVAKSATPLTVAPGGTITYTITYSNTGNQDALGVTLTETLPLNTSFDAGASSPAWSCAAQCTLSVGALDAGTSGSATFVVTVDATVPAGVDTITNTVLIAAGSGSPTDPTPANNTATATVTLDAAPALTISKTDGGISTTPGSVLVYTITVTNTGNQDATGVIVSETVPAGATFNEQASSPGWLCVGSDCTLDLGTVSAGLWSSFSFAVTVDSPVAAGREELLNIVSATDDGANSPSPATASASETTPLIAAPDLAITKSDGGLTTAPGQTLVYTLTLANSGDQNASGVAITEVVPNGATFNDAASTAGWTCADNAPAGTICTLVVGNFAVGDDVSALFAITIDSFVPAGLDDITNTATVADDGAGGADGDSSDNTATETTPLNAAPVLVLDKDDGGVTIRPGQTLVYTLTVSNTGDQTAAGVTITETVPLHTSFNAAASSPGWSCVGTTCTFFAGIVGGANVEAIFAVTVDRPLPAGVSSIINTASVSDDGANSPAPAEDSATIQTPVVTSIDLGILKSAAPAVVMPGDTVTYTLVYSSVSDTIATGVTLTDTLPAEVTFQSLTSSGAVITQTSGAPNLAWDVAPLLPDQGGTITITALVDPSLASEGPFTNTAAISHTEDIAPANNTASAAIDVNLAPVADAGGPYTVNEGATVVVDSSASSDPGADALTFAWDLDNDGSFETAGVTATFTNTVDDGVLTIALQATDADGASAVATTTVTVLNVAPTVDAGADRTAAPGQVILFNGAFTDPGIADTHTFAWDFGDGATATTLDATHSFASSGIYTVTLTVTDDDGGIGSDSLTVEVGSAVVFLPFMARPQLYSDLVVKSVTSSPTEIVVTIRNQGQAPATEAFWVDLYINPDPAPTAVNQIWQALADHGMVWGVSGGALPLDPGEELTLRAYDPYFRADFSSIPPTIDPGAQIYVQVDSANADTTYGAVNESHEVYGQPYNNISSPYTVPAPIVISAPPRPYRPQSPALPQRPEAIRRQR